MKKPKLMVIGIDSVSLTLLDAFKPSCPAIRKAMRQGTAGRAIPCLPVYTPTNWAALSTGADPSKTAAAGWHNDVAGATLSTFDRRAIPCDTIFDAAARKGLTTLAIAYPTAYPAKSPRNMVLAPLDRGLVSNSLVPGKIVDLGGTDIPVCPQRMTGKNACPPGEFRFPLVEAPGAASGAAQAKAAGATEDGASLSGRVRRTDVQAVEAFVYRGRNGARLGLRPGRENAPIRLRLDAWSEPIPVCVSSPGRPGKCVVRVMLFDGGRRLAVSEAYDVGMLGKPAKLARAVYEKLGPPIEHSVFAKAMAALNKKGLDDRVIARLARADVLAQADWIVRAAALVQKLAPFDVFYLHHHYPDSVLHDGLYEAEGLGGTSPKRQRLAKAAIALSLEGADRVVAGLMKLAGPKTAVLLVSDHGNVPNRYACNLARRLVDAGLLVRGASGEPDRRRSLAWVHPLVNTWVMVNARPRTRRCEELQAKVIDALLDWKTAKGERVVAVALRRKDSHLLGYAGTHCGDVTFHYNSGFAWFGAFDHAVIAGGGANHGPQMPVTFSKLSDNLSFFALKGPNVPRAGRHDPEHGGYVNLVDLVPTACRLAGVPAPVDATGAVRFDLMKKPF